MDFSYELRPGYQNFEGDPVCGFLIITVPYDSDINEIYALAAEKAVEECSGQYPHTVDFFTVEIDCLEIDSTTYRYVVERVVHFDYTVERL